MDDSTEHTASRVIVAPPRAIYRSFLDREGVGSWRAPKGMVATVYSFDPRVGGGYRMEFRYEDGRDAPGKSKPDADIFKGRFVDLVPHERIVEEVMFETDDPAFTGAMTVTTTLQAVAGGTKVTLAATDVPPGINPADHRAGMESTLKNLANFVE